MPAAGGGGGGSVAHFFILSTNAPRGNTDSLSVQTIAFTPSNNCLLVVHASTLSSTDISADWSMSGGSLTWTRRVSLNTNSSGYYRAHEIWTAPVGTAASMSVTWSHTGTIGYANDGMDLIVHCFTNYNSSSPIGATATALMSGVGSGSVTLSGTPASTSYLAASRAITPNEAIDCYATEGTGWAEVADLLVGSAGAGLGGIQAQVVTGTTSTSVTWNDLLVATGSAFLHASGLAIEVKAAP